MLALGLIAAFPLPPEIKAAYGVETAQQLADQIGITKAPTIWMRGDATKAYEALKNGDQAPAMAMLTQRLGASEQNAREALAKLPAL